MTIIYLIITSIIGIMAINGGFAYGDLIGFASLLVTILIFYSIGNTKRIRDNTTFELKIAELEIKIKELDGKKMDSIMCDKMHGYTQQSIEEIKSMIKGHQIEIMELIKNK